MIIGCIFCKYHYGDERRGLSLEYLGMYPALKELGHDVRVLWIDDLLADHTVLQRRVLDFVEREQPQMVFFMLMDKEIDIKTLDAVRDKASTVNWFCDDAWRFDSFSRQLAPHFTYAITTNKFALKRYRDMGYQNVVHCQWAAFQIQPDIEFYSQQYEYDISFIGMKSAYRAWFLGQLRRRGYAVGCFGHGWDGGALSTDDMARIIRRSRINLNVSNSICYDVRCLLSNWKAARRFIGAALSPHKKTADTVKARVFEIPACGGFELAHYVPGIEDYYVIGQELAAYTALDDLLRQIDYYLEHEPLRQQIAERGYQRTLRDHLYSKRLKHFFETIAA